MGFFGCIGIKKPLISKKNKKAQLKFGKDDLNWTIKSWKKLAFQMNLNLIFLEVMVDNELVHWSNQQKYECCYLQGYFRKQLVIIC